MDTSTQFKFFIVDDDIFCASLYEQYLRNLRFTNITSFNNGIDCLNNLDQKPDIIFLDHNMDDISGFDVLKKIKRFNPNIYVVMVSGQETMKTTVDALKYGAFDYIIKDGTVSERMKAVIETIINVKAQLKKSHPSFIQRLLSIF